MERINLRWEITYLHKSRLAETDQCKTVLKVTVSYYIDDASHSQAGQPVTRPAEKMGWLLRFHTLPPSPFTNHRVADMGLCNCN